MRIVELLETQIKPNMRLEAIKLSQALSDYNPRVIVTYNPNYPKLKEFLSVIENSTARGIIDDEGKLLINVEYHPIKLKAVKKLIRGSGAILIKIGDVVLAMLPIWTNFDVYAYTPPFNPNLSHTILNKYCKSLQTAVASVRLKFSSESNLSCDVVAFPATTETLKKLKDAFYFLVNSVPGEDNENS